MDNKTFNSAYYMETKSPSYARTLLDCKRVAASNANVLLIGESGTGKDVAAQYIHALSRRSDKPFIAVNCNAYTESLLEPELSAWSRGSFPTPSAAGWENSSWPTTELSSWMPSATSA